MYSLVFLTEFLKKIIVIITSVPKHISVCILLYVFMVVNTNNTFKERPLSFIEPILIYFSNRSISLLPKFRNLLFHNSDDERWKDSINCFTIRAHKEPNQHPIKREALT